jgi:hypothetical protein
MKILAGVTVGLSVLGLVASLSVNEKYTGYGAALKLTLFVLSVFSGVFGILYLIVH